MREMSGVMLPVGKVDTLLLQRFQNNEIRKLQQDFRF